MFNFDCLKDLLTFRKDNENDIDFRERLTIKYTVFYSRIKKLYRIQQLAFPTKFLSKLGERTIIIERAGDSFVVFYGYDKPHIVRGLYGFSSTWKNNDCIFELRVFKDRVDFDTDLELSLHDIDMAIYEYERYIIEKCFVGKNEKYESEE